MTSKNRLGQIIYEFEKRNCLQFKPTLAFFTQIGIGRKRFHQLCRNEKGITFGEMERLASYFGVHVLEMHEKTKPLLSATMTIEKALG